jgi:hypothetical protein
MAGGLYMKTESRWKLVLGWVVGLGVLLSLYYLKAEL